MAVAVAAPVRRPPLVLTPLAEGGVSLSLSFPLAVVSMAVAMSVATIAITMAVATIVAVARFSDHHSEEGEGEEDLRKDKMVNSISKILSYLISPGVSLCGELKLQ